MAANIRPGLSEASFRRYEPLIRAAYTEPSGVTFTAEGTGLSTATLVARLRDAIRGLRMYRYSTDWPVDFNQLATVRVIERDGHIHAGKPIVALGVVAPALSARVDPPTPTEIKLVTPERDEVVDIPESLSLLSQSYVVDQTPDVATIEAYALLAHRHLPGLPKLYILRPSNAALVTELEAFLATLESSYDVAVVSAVDHWIVL